MKPTPNTNPGTALKMLREHADLSGRQCGVYYNNSLGRPVGVKPENTWYRFERELPEGKMLPHRVIKAAISLFAGRGNPAITVDDIAQFGESGHLADAIERRALIKGQTRVVADTMPVTMVASRSTLMSPKKWAEYSQGPSNVVENPEWGEGQYVVIMGEDQVYFPEGARLHCRTLESMVDETLVERRVVMYVPNKQMRGTGHIQVGRIYEEEGDNLFVEGGDGLALEGELKGIVGGVYMEV